MSTFERISPYRAGHSVFSGQGEKEFGAASFPGASYPKINMIGRSLGLKKNLLNG